MKTLKISLMALVFTVGIGGAVVQKIQAAPKPQEQVYTWNRNVAGMGTSPFSGTITSAQDHYGCTSDNTLCATGKASGVPDAQIFQP